MKIILLFSTICLISNSYSQVPQTLEEYSKEINQELPEIFDSITKLVTTSVEHNNLKYQFVVDVNRKEYQWAISKVREQVLKKACFAKREKTALIQLKANLIYSYENVKGQSLGLFVIRPEHCAVTRKN